ncbi:MAG: TRAP transporter large permease [Alphaproteobacteria bacterium]|nr:TRAP transporter large permease [Alphaproteobacteria bacterium]MBU0889211.1 TRAP transporter large permease [Alphaproteobacteria bacterium]MBU1813800.1 TRAP transporter large permease [Alphaproteobacteria bacterium]
MSGMTLALLGFPALLLLLALRIPIGVALLTIGGAGYIAMAGWMPLLGYLKTGPYALFSSYTLSVVPLFLLMGQFAAKAGISQALFTAAAAFLGHRRGGIAMAAIGGCAGFGAICGSSLATAATMAQVALPELKRHGYSGRLATGTLAAGGTLGILIPPSVVLVIYAILTEQNIASLFVAAFVPGILAALFYMLAIAVVVRLDPAAGPAGPRRNAAERLAALAAIWPVGLIFLLVIGGIYGGWFTPTEAAAVGAFGTGVLAVLRGGMRLAGLVACIKGTAEATAMIFLVLLGAELFNAFLALTRMPVEAAGIIGGSGLAPMIVLLAILALYLLLGCVMDSLSMILLTVPIFFPIVMALDFGLTPDETAIWFGILALTVVEIGLITPPVGLNVFIINQAARDVPMLETFKGVLPFLAADALRIALLLALPGLSLWLLRVM